MQSKAIMKKYAPIDRAKIEKEVLTSNTNKDTQLDPSYSGGWNQTKICHHSENNSVVGGL